MFKYKKYEYRVMQGVLASVLTIFIHVIAQAEDCLRRERDRVSHYLHSTTEQKLVEVNVTLIFLSCFRLKFLLDEE